jgi:glycosyltransferase involved in cell wall biosynthesis
MRVAINALPLRSSHHGVGRYICNLLAALLEIDRDTHYIVYVTRAGSEALAVGNAPNIEPRILDFPRPMRVAWEHLRLPSLLARDHVDVYFGMAHVLPVRRTVAHVVTVHDLSWYVHPEMHQWLKTLYFKWLIPRSLRQATRVFVVSHCTRNDVARLVGIEAPRIAVTALGVDSRFRPHTDLELRSSLQRLALDRPYLLHLGVREPRKNLKGLLRAYREILLRRPGFSYQLVLGGEESYGWKNRDARRMLNDPIIRDRVRILGAIPDHLLPCVLSGATVFVFPSFYEGFGLPVLEAMASGTAVVTSRISALPEVCGEAAAYVNDPSDSSQIARAIEQVVDNDALRNTMIRLGIDRARQFTWSRCANDTLEGLRDVYERKRQRGGRRTTQVGI